MTPRKLKAFRVTLRNELWKAFPRLDAATIWAATERIEKVVLREAVQLAAVEHADDCACWQCLTDLHGSIMRHNAQMRVDREAAGDHD